MAIPGNGGTQMSSQAEVLTSKEKSQALSEKARLVLNELRTINNALAETKIVLEDAEGKDHEMNLIELANKIIDFNLDAQHPYAVAFFEAYNKVQADVMKEKRAAGNLNGVAVATNFFNKAKIVDKQTA